MNYIKFSPSHVPMGHAIGQFNGYNTKKDSVKNGKPYMAEAKVEGYEPFDPKTQVRTGPVYEPDPPVIRWIVRDKTADELAAEKDMEADSVLNQRGIKALVGLLNDGSFIPGSNYTAAQIKAIVRAKL